MKSHSRISVLIVIGAFLWGCSSPTPNTTSEIETNPGRKELNESRADVNLIVPNERVGLLYLNDTSGRAFEVLGKSTFEDYDYAKKGSGCGQREIQWLLFGTHGKHTFNECPDKKIHELASDIQFTEVRGYFRDNKLYQIAVDSTYFTTKEGIGRDELPKTVQDNFSKTESFTIPESASKFTGERDQVFWVDQIGGIAFELYYLGQNGGRRIRRIYVFSPEIKFSPTGCSQEPESWIQLKPFSLEPPRKRI